MGLGITPLATIIMAGMKPEQAGATSGVLATLQNVGNALGVAVIGVVFFGALSHGYADAFELSLGVLAGCCRGRRADEAAPGAGTLVMCDHGTSTTASGRCCVTGASAAG